MPMKSQLTAVFEEVAEGYIGFVEELPGTKTQAATLEEARANLAEAVELVFDANRALAEERLGDRDLIREPLSIPASSEQASSVTSRAKAATCFEPLEMEADPRATSSRSPSAAIINLDPCRPRCRLKLQDRSRPWRRG
jgi:predicted RNase H-like HicB family nuclease